MRYPAWIQVAGLAACAGLVFAASRLSPAINSTRDQLNMIGTESAIENAPPEYAFALQAFGAFRNIITDVAFMRAEHLKEHGRYYDAVPLYRFICQLQPRFPTVWEFLGWNLSWNISVTTYTPEERWNWVYAGVKLMRDEGIQYNPRGLNLYKQLAWTFENKMGETTDDYHWSYKCNWAWRMHLLLGAPPRPLNEQADADVRPLDIDDPLLKAVKRSAEIDDAIRLEKARQDGIPFIERKPVSAGPSDDKPFDFQVAQRVSHAFIRAIADAPSTLETLYAAYPETCELVEKLRDLGCRITDEPLSEDAYWNQEGLAWSFFERYRKLSDPPSILRSLMRDAREEADPRQARFEALLSPVRDAPAGRELVRFLQRKVLTEVYKLDPAHMAYVVEAFGPVDWRLVNAHTLYWISLALIRGGETVHTFQNDRINTARLLFFSLRNIFGRNKLAFEPNPGKIHLSYINLTPDLNFVETMHRAFIDYGGLLDPRPSEQGGGAGEIYRTGHVNFLTEAIRLLWLKDRKREAQRYYEYLAHTYGRRFDGELEERYRKPLDQFVMESLYRTLDGPREVLATVSSIISLAFDELAEGNVPRYNDLVQKARQIRDAYMEDKQRDLVQKRLLADFGYIQIDVLMSDLAATPAISPTALVNKVKLWRNTPPNLKRWVYDDAIPFLTQECERFNFDVAKAFPEPPGMSEFRERHPGRSIQERRERTADTPVQPSIE